METFSEVIKKHREMKGLSLRKLSQLSGVPTTSIFNYENGVEPTIEPADKILKALGIRFIMGEEEAE